MLMIGRPADHLCYHKAAIARKEIDVQDAKNRYVIDSVRHNI